MKYFLISIYVILALNFVSNAQTGPGGIGTTDGTSDLRWWYDANHESYANGASVNSVSDLSGYGNTLSASGSEQPTFETPIGLINSKSAFVFDATDDELESSYKGNSNETMSYIIVMQQGSTDATVRVAVQQGGRNTVSTKSGNAFDFVGNANHTSSTATTSNWLIHTHVFLGGTVGSTITNGIIFYNNGTQTDAFTYDIEDKTDNTWIGGHGSGGGASLNGKIAEVMKFTKKITEVERTIIENYLSKKYGITISNSKYSGSYTKEIIGIGKENGESILKSNDNKGLTLEQNSGFTDGDYVFAGNDLDVNENIYTDIGGVAELEARWKRIWYFEITGTGNNVDITFDISEGGFSGTAGTVSNYKLLFRSGTSGDWTDAGTASSVSGDQITFTNNSLSNGDGYYTIGTKSSVNSTLPVTLIEFNAKFQNNIINIDWKTATEINNDFFNVERSMDANNWESITQINGAGNSNEILSYNYVDNNPIDGISYYRLKQTDFDGKYEYSNIRKVDLSQKSNLSIYPNPTQNSITIDGYNNDLIDIQIYNSLGKELSSSISYSRISDNSVKMNLSDLAKGVYFIKIDNEMIKVFKN